MLAEDTRLLGQRQKTLYSEHNKHHEHQHICINSSCSAVLQGNVGGPPKMPAQCYQKGILTLENMNLLCGAVSMLDLCYLPKLFTLQMFWKESLEPKAISVSVARRVEMQETRENRLSKKNCPLSGSASSYSAAVIGKNYCDPIIMYFMKSWTMREESVLRWALQKQNLRWRFIWRHYPRTI